MSSMLAFSNAAQSSLPNPTSSDTENPILHLEKLFHLNLPPWLFATLSILALIAALIALLSPIFGPAKAIVNFIAKMITRRRPANTKRARRRAQFADHVESQLRRLSEKEEWRDDRFTELEAEVEIEGQQRRGGILAFLPSRSEALRRVNSLSSALVRSTERLIILQGEPGSGKSVALRHVGQGMAQAAMRNPSEKSIIPLYLNLREFRPSKHPVDDNEFRNFVFRSLNRANNRDVERFLDHEFDRGMTEGTWLFLLDSFDEIPDILSAVEVDSVVEEYADALHEFLHGWNRSRGIIASREFRGPRRFGWPKFTIVRLSARQKADLISRADLPPEGEEELIGGLADADPTIIQLSDNPLFLGLLCEHIRGGRPFPQNTHTVFESYITTRLQRDAELVRKRFAITPDDIRAVAEEVAFEMAAAKSLGLEATRDEIHQALAASSKDLKNVNIALDALEYIKLARSNEDSDQTSSRTFTFAHRRFQEYFATCVVLREPGRISLDALLVDGRWRETAVTILQAQKGELTEKILNRAEELLKDSIPQDVSGADGDRDSAGEPFQWPAGSLHLLGLLNAGMGKRAEQITPTLRAVAGQLLDNAWQSGRRHDKKWAVEVAPVADSQITTRIIEGSFASKSALLRQAAYAQAGRLGEMPESLSLNMRKALVGLSCGGRLRKERIAVRAQLKRLANPTEYLRGATFLTLAPVLDFSLIFISVFLLASVTSLPIYDDIGISIAAAALVNSSFFALRVGPSYALAPSLSVAGQMLFRIISAGMTRPDDNNVYSALQAVGRYVRFLAFCNIGAIIAVISISHLTAVSAFACVLYLYAVAWSFSGLYLFVRGTSTAVWVWPLFPFIHLRIIARRSLHRVSDLMPRSEYGKFAQQVGMWTIYLALLGGFIFAQVHWSIVGYVWQGVTGLFLASFISAFIFRGVRTLAYRHKDRRLLGQQLAAVDILSADDLPGLLASIRTDEGLKALVRALRRSHRSFPNEIIEFFSDLSAYAELAQRYRGSTLSANQVSPRIQSWLDKREASGKSLSPANISNDTLDEITQLIEAHSLPTQ